MDTPALILQHSSTYIQGFFWTYFYCVTLHPRWSKKICFIGMMATFILISTPITFGLSLLPAVKTIIWVVIDLTLMRIFFTDKILRLIFIKMMQFFILALSELIAIFAGELFFHKAIREIFGSNGETLFLYLVFYFPCVILFFHFGAKLVNELTKKLEGIQVGILLGFGFFPFSQIVTLFYLSLLITFKFPSLYGIYLVFFGLCIVISVAADILLIRIIKDTAKKAELETTNIYLQQQKEMQLQHYQAFVDQQEETRKLRHDIMNHVQTIKLLIAQSKIAKADTYADKLVQRFGEITTVDYCDNKIIDAVLHNKMEYAGSLRIQGSIKVAVEEKSSIDDLDLMAVFSNLLDNAIHAAAKAEEERYFSLATANKGNMLVIKIENSGDGSPIQPQKKEPGKRSGLGLKILKQITDKYNGSIVFHQEDTHYETIVMLDSESQCSK